MPAGTGLFDIVGGAEGELGNVMVSAGLEATVRLGLLAETLRPRAPMPSLALDVAPLFRVVREACVFARARGRGVAYNAFIQGTMFADSVHTVGRYIFVSDIDVGFQLSLGPVSVSASLVFRSTEANVRPLRWNDHRYGQLQMHFQPDGGS